MWRTGGISGTPVAHWSLVQWCKSPATREAASAKSQAREVNACSSALGGIVSAKLFMERY